MRGVHIHDELQVLPRRMLRRRGSGYGTGGVLVLIKAFTSHPSSYQSDVFTEGVRDKLLAGLRRLLVDLPCTLTSAPTTPRLVNLRYSNGRDLLTVCRNG